MSDKVIKHPLERFIGFVGMTAILRYGYSFIDSELTLSAILLYLVVGFAILILLEAVFKRLARKLPLFPARYLLPLYAIYLYVFFLSFYSSAFGFSL
ncbi:hypothetical protein [Exiguobacterium flavidum]|uniref:hypothetical protein n=1 Tax=Exiguobacterium flavidum TaxID=2184695 RepID=UPI000DF85A73|nr:hypothetical protein [Exiguobacterium flavidum]